MRAVSSNRWGNRCFGAEGRDLGDTPQNPLCLLKKEKAAGFHCLAPLVSLLSLQLGLLILPSAASVSRTNPEPVA